MKKTLSTLLVLALALSCFLLASCGGSEESSEAVSSSSSEAESSATSEEASVESAVSEEASVESAVSEEASVESAVSEEASEVVSEEASEESAVSEEVSEELPDISESVSYKLLTEINPEKEFYFSATAQQGTMSIGREIGVFQGKSFLKNIMGNMAMTEIIKDGKKYTVNEAAKTYTVADAGNTENAFASFVDGLLGAATYTKSAQEDLNGATYTVDTFKLTADGSEVKIYVSSENKVEFLFMSNLLFDVEISETLPEGCFDIPADFVDSTPA